MRTLKLTIKKKWFDKILSGEKKHEYREIKPYWTSRITGKTHTHVQFFNGCHYGKNLPNFTCELRHHYTGMGVGAWGAPKKYVYILVLGEIIEKNNIGEK